MVWSANGASVTAYPYISVPFGVRPLARGARQGPLALEPNVVCRVSGALHQSYDANMCLTSLAFSTVETGSSCATPQFQIGLVNDADWYAYMCTPTHRSCCSRTTDAALYNELPKIAGMRA